MGFFDRFKSKPAATTVSSADSVARIMVVLECDGDQVLFILLADDGTINRMGTGTEDNREQGLFIGVIDTAAFVTVRSVCSPVLDDWIRMQRVSGANCWLVFRRLPAQNC